MRYDCLELLDLMSHGGNKMYILEGDIGGT